MRTSRALVKCAVLTPFFLLALVCTGVILSALFVEDWILRKGAAMDGWEMAEYIFLLTVASILTAMVWFSMRLPPCC